MLRSPKGGPGTKKGDKVMKKSPSDKLLEEMRAHKAGEGAKEAYQNMKLCKDIIDYVFEHMAPSCQHFQPAMPIHDEFAGECIFKGTPIPDDCSLSNCPLLKG